MSSTALHGDVAGYSRLIADNEIETINTLQAFGAIIEATVSAHSGEMRSLVGDEFLAVFPSEQEAVDGALEMQRQIAEENQRLPEGRKMQFRLGLHSGVINRSDGGWYGDVINIAARLQALGDPGGVTVSAGVLGAAGDLDVGVDSMGLQRLKNIPEPVLAYRLVDEGLPGDSEKPWRRRISTSTTPSLAVSPFINLGDPDDDHFAAGLMMSLIVSLMTIPGLDVISENSTLAYSDTAHSAQQLSHELGARFVLEGAVQRSENRVRVMAQVVDAESKTTVWAERFEESIEDLFLVQDDLVDKIVAALDVEVIGGGRIYRDELDAATVEVLYKGWQDLIRGTPASTRSALEAFEKVTEAAPNSAVGPATAAWTYMWEVLKDYASDPEANIDRAEELAQRAQEIGDPAGFSYAVMAYVHLWRRDFAGAYESAVQATAERPSCDISFGVAASVMRYLGRWEEAVDFADRAIHLSPLLSEWYRATMANAYFIGGDYEMAADTAEGVVSRNEEDVEALLTLAASQSALGRDRHAAAAVQQARTSEPGLSAGAVRSRLLYKDNGTLDRFMESLEKAGLE